MFVTILLGAVQSNNKFTFEFRKKGSINMGKLRIGSYEIEILDYYSFDIAFHVDAKMRNEEEIKKLLLVLNKNNGRKGICEFEIEEKSYIGYCSMYYYDKNYNVRIIMIPMSDEEYGEENHFVRIFDENLKKILDNQRRAIVDIVKVLKEKGIMEEFEEKKILDYIPEGEYGQAIFHMVNNLDEYLKERKIRMEDLKGK